MLPTETSPNLMATNPTTVYESFVTQNVKAGRSLGLHQERRDSMRYCAARPLKRCIESELQGRMAMNPAANNSEVLFGQCRHNFSNFIFECSLYHRKRDRNSHMTRDRMKFRSHQNSESWLLAVSHRYKCFCRPEDTVPNIAQDIAAITFWLPSFPDDS
jgi:hypothetical protein